MEKPKEGRGFWGRLFGRTVNKPPWPERTPYPTFPVEPAEPVAVSTVDVENIREKARRAVNELASQDTRKKFFYLVIDDDLIKFRDDMRYFLEPLMREEQNRDWEWVSEVELDGESGIALYKAFREADSQEHPISIVIQIDGNLAPLNPSASPQNCRNIQGKRMGNTASSRRFR